MPGAPAGRTAIGQASSGDAGDALTMTDRGQKPHFRPAANLDIISTNTRHRPARVAAWKPLASWRFLIGAMYRPPSPSDSSWARETFTPY